MMQRLYAIALMLAVLSGCSSSEPDASMTQRAFVDGVGGDDKVNVLNFEKTNGQTAEQNGVKVYTSYFKANVIWPHGLNVNCMNHQYSTFHSECWFLRPSDMAAPGTQQELQSQILFQQTEKGWMTASGKIY